MCKRKNLKRFIILYQITQRQGDKVVSMLDENENMQTEKNGNKIIIGTIKHVILVKHRKECIISLQI